MSDSITRFFRGSCPIHPEGQTVTITYNNSEHKLVSTICPGENKCTAKTCPVKECVASLYE